MAYLILPDNNQTIERYNVSPTTDSVTLNPIRNPPFMDKGVKILIQSSPHNVCDPEETYPVPSMAYSKDDTIIDSDEDL